MADPRGLTPQQIDALAREGSAVVLVSLGMHSTEVSSSQMGPRLAHRLATSNDERIRTILDNTIFLLIPGFNPDGQDIVGEWVKKTAGTPYEGSGTARSLQRLYRARQQSRRVHADPGRVAALREGHLRRVVSPGVHGRAPAGQLRRADHDSAQVRSDQPERRSAGVALVELLGGAMGTGARGGRDDRRRIESPFRRVVHVVLPHHLNQHNIPGFHTESASARRSGRSSSIHRSCSPGRGAGRKTRHK